MKPGLLDLGFLAVSAGVLGLYFGAERGGWASGGTERPPIEKEQLRQTSPGSWHYVYWGHGFRGK